MENLPESSLPEIKIVFCRTRRAIVLVAIGKISDVCVGDDLHIYRLIFYRAAAFCQR
jgi:hypothetical protein